MLARIIITFFFIVCTGPLAGSVTANAAACSFPLVQAQGVSCDGVLVNAADTGSIYNAGTINQGGAAYPFYAIRNYGTITNLTNTTTGSITDIIETHNSLVNFNNYGLVSSSTLAVHTTQNLTNLTNYEGASIISSNSHAVWVDTFGVLDKLDNFGNIKSNSNTSIRNSGTINLLINETSGIITGTKGISNEYNGANTGTILKTLINYGTINNGVFNSATIVSLTNKGVINGGISNEANATITTLNNLQGNSNGSNALSYNGRLPSMYNIIITQTGYGQLNATNASGTLKFGVFNGDNTNNITASVPQNNKRYKSVLMGVSSSNIETKSGTYNGLNWKLVEKGSGIWDLIFGVVGPDVWNTYKTLTSNRDALLGAMHQRYAVLNTVIEYDCSRFDKYGVCISFQARSTGWGTQTTGAGVLNIAYRIHPKVRFGAYLDYQVAQGTTIGTNYGSGGIQNGFNNPTFGGYIGFTQSNDNLGLQAKVSGGYNSGKITITRALLDDTEGGSGNAALNAYYAFGNLGYGLKLTDKATLTPYAGLLYTNIIRNGYTESANSLVLYPLAYNSFYEQLITGIGGLKLTSMLSDKLGCQIGLGAQLDLKRNANSYSGYSYIPGMEAYGIAHGGSWNGTRPTAQAGAFYNVTKNEQLVVNAYAGQQAFTTRTYTSLLAGYQVSF